MSREAARGLESVAKLTGGRFAAQLVMLVAAVVIPRLLGADAYGVYAAWMAVVAIGGGLATFGLPMVETRYLAPLWSLGNRPAALALGSTIWTIKLALATFAGGGVALWLFISPRLEASTAVTLCVGLLAFALYAHEAAISLYLPFGRVGTLSLFVLLRACLMLPVVVLSFLVWELLGIAAGMAALYIVLWLLSWRVLTGIAPLTPRGFHWAALRPYLAFSLAAFAANVAWRVQGHFSIYALANWVTPQEAAYLALALQLYNFLQLLILSARRALTPILAEMETRGESHRVQIWGDLVMRWTAATVAVAALGWGLIGGDVVRLVFSDSFAPVHPTAALILGCALLYGCAESCNMLLYVQGRARHAAFTMMVYAAFTIAGLLVALRGPATGSAERTALAYVIAALVYFTVSYGVLFWASKIRLPIGRSLLLALPAFASPGLAAWQAPLALRLTTLSAALVFYGAAAVAFELLPAEELRTGLRWLRTRGRPEEGDASK
jgi:O-antigen/teichoic acid export membrane protein